MKHVSVKETRRLNESRHRMTRLERKNVCCTDILFLLIFIVFIIGWLTLSFYSVHFGDSSRLLNGYDSYGNICNKKNNVLINGVKGSGMDTTGLKYVFFMSYWNPFRAKQICVKKCPDKKILTKEDLYKFRNDTNSNLCDYSIEKKDMKDTEYENWGPCPSLPIMKGVSILGRCIPDLKMITSLVDKSIATSSEYYAFLANMRMNYYHKVIEDIRNNRNVLMMFCFSSFIVSMLMVIMIRYMAAVVIWTVVFVSIVSSIGVSIYTWILYIAAKKEMDYLTEHMTPENKTMLMARDSFYLPLLPYSVSFVTGYLVISIIFTVVAVILLLMTIAMRNRLELVIEIFYEAGKCIIDQPFLLLQPLMTFAFLLLLFIYWIAIYGFISTLGVPTTDYKLGHERVMYKPSTLHRVIWWYHMIALIWISEFILACQQFVIGGAVGQWYFTRNKRELNSPISLMIRRLLTSHIGSIAFGSFIIVLIRIPRYILMYIDRELNQSKSEVAKVLLKCCVCCLYCLEKFMKFINQNAYALIAIEGISFCAAAIKSFRIITENILRVAVLNSVGDFVLMLGKIAISMLSMFIAMLYFKNKDNIHNYYTLVTFIGMFSFLIGHCFLTVYEMVVDTILLCYCEDSSMMDNLDGAPTFTNEEFHNTMKRANKKIGSVVEMSTSRSRTSNSQ